MEFFVTTTAAARQRTDCAIVGVYDKGVLSAGAEAIDARIGKRIARLIERGDVRGKSGEVLLLADVTGGPCERLVIVGLGARNSFKRKQYRKALTSAITAVAKTGARDAVSYLSLESLPDADTYTLARTAAEVAGSAQYRVPDHKSNRRPRPTLTQFGVAVADRGQRGNAERVSRTAAASSPA